MDSWVIMMPRERILVDCLSLSDTVSVHRISNRLRFARIRMFLINFSITWHYTFSLLRNDCNIHAPVHFKGCNYEIVHAQRLFSYRSCPSVSNWGELNRCILPLVVSMLPLDCGQYPQDSAFDRWCPGWWAVTVRRQLVSDG